MSNCGLQLQAVANWFVQESQTTYVLARLNTDDVAQWAKEFGIALRRCYIADSVLQKVAIQTGLPQTELIAAKLPDPGSVMSGDFGEILVYFYQAAIEYPAVAAGALKWRLKQDRTAPAPKSDVLHMVLPSWPLSSDKDRLLCSEVKAKATSSTFDPITDAIKGCQKDRTSRLSDTLQWLRERSLFDSIGDITREQLDRFIHALAHPPAQWTFRAVAVISADLLTGELANSAPTTPPEGYTVVVLVVPSLKNAYTTAFSAAGESTVQAQKA